MSVVFDNAHFDHMTGGDVSLQAELITLFCDQAELWRRVMIPEAPTPLWRDAAHTAKGSAKGLGLWALADACEDAEMLGRTGAIEGAIVAATLARARAALDVALNALRAQRLSPALA